MATVSINQLQIFVLNDQWPNHHAEATNLPFKLPSSPIKTSQENVATACINIVDNIGIQFYPSCFNDL